MNKIIDIINIITPILEINVPNIIISVLFDKITTKNPKNPNIKPIIGKK